MIVMDSMVSEDRMEEVSLMYSLKICLGKEKRKIVWRSVSVGLERKTLGRMVRAPVILQQLARKSEMVVP